MRSTGSEADRVRVHVYQARDGLRWSVLSANGDKIADGGQGYSDRRDLVRGLHLATGTGGIVSSQEPIEVADCRHHDPVDGVCREWLVQR